MATGDYCSLEKLKLGECQQKIKVRVIRFWRGVTRTGQEFKNFNLILMDKQSKRMHAFVPTKCADELQSQITVGKMYTFKNFEVQLYSATEKFRVLRNESQLVFSKDTKVQEVVDDGVTIGHDAFDFYDHSQLEELTRQTTYLTDLVGIIKKHQKLRDMTNKHGIEQQQAKITITDGRSNVNVTFWDKFGERFEQAMKNPLEEPVIIILSACRVGKWNGEVDISHVPATKVYLNHKHHSVVHLRKLLKDPAFAKQALGNDIVRPLEQQTVEKIHTLGKDYIDACVFTHVKITGLDESMSWMYNSCTDCGRETRMDGPCPVCETCRRFIEYPDKKFRVHVFATDLSGQMQVVLGDREVRTLIGMRARDVVSEDSSVTQLPKILYNIVGKDYSLIIKVRQINVDSKFRVYWATNICRGFVSLPKQGSQEDANTEGETSQATTTTINTETFPDINLSCHLEN